jgi:hypothetical protein
VKFRVTIETDENGVFVADISLGIMGGLTLAGVASVGQKSQVRGQRSEDRERGLTLQGAAGEMSAG